jgi:hypothetical protein
MGDSVTMLTEAGVAAGAQAETTKTPATNVLKSFDIKLSSLFSYRA